MPRRGRGPKLDMPITKTAALTPPWSAAARGVWQRQPQLERERGALSRHARHVHAAAVQRQELTRDRETKPGAAEAHRRLVGGLRELRKYAIDHVGGMPIPVSATATSSVTA